MGKTDIKFLYDNYEKLENQTVTINGWIKSVRDNKNFGFMDIMDGTNFKSVQAVVMADAVSNYADVVKLNTGSSVKVVGKVCLTPQMKQPFEIKAESVEILNATDSDYPLQKKRSTREFLREIAYLRPRTNLFQAIFRIRSVAAYAIHRYFQDRNYLYVHTPLITCADCEGSDQMFKISTLNFDNPPMVDGKIDFSKDLFGKKAFITGSGQLHGETFAMAFNKIYTFGPTFRTENSNTKIHANEFWMIEPEMAFCDLNGLMDVEEEMLKEVVKYVLSHCENELKFCNDFVDNTLLEKLNKLVNSNFTRISHKEVVDILKKADVKWEIEPDYKEDIAKEHERYITEYFNGPVFITNWPKDIKAYYMKVNADGETVAAVDLVVPQAGELMGGSQREENYDKLVKRMEEMNVDTSNIEWYVNLRKFGSCEHSGFGMGFERLIIYLTGVDNIRDVIPFPRTPNNCDY